MNRKKNFLTKYNIQLFEMHNLNMMLLYALQFVTCKVCVDAFRLLYSKLSLEILSLFIFGASFAEWH